MSVAFGDVRLPERFWDKATVEADGCWLWRAYVSPKGYSRFRFDGETRFGHIVAYEVLVGSLPEGTEIDHLCRVRACVNPEHLEPVSHAENIRRSVRVRVTHCLRGHEFDAENTYIAKSGQRVCRACMRMHKRAFYARQKEAVS